MSIFLLLFVIIFFWFYQRDVLSDAKDTLSGSAFERELREGEPIIPVTEVFFSEDGSNSSPSSSIRRVAVPRFDFD
jgi:hypothetical protein